MVGVRLWASPHNGAGQVAANPALADNPYDIHDHPNPQAAQAAAQHRAVVDQCSAIWDATAGRAAAQRDKVYHYANDYNAREGYILNSPLQVFMCDVRQELDRTRQQFHRMAYRTDLTVGDCVAVAAQLTKRLDCFYQHTVRNDAAGMRSCSDIYEVYVDADRHYGGIPAAR